MFQTLDIDFTDTNTFPLFASACKVQDMHSGRSGGIIVLPSASGAIPIVRTTMKCVIQSQLFQPIHMELVGKFGKQFNNGMVEIYTDVSKSMAFHTDCAIDLQPESYIALYTSYENHEERHLRELHIKNKATGDIYMIPLRHNMVVMFSTEVNRQHLHKITLPHAKSSRWLGITFRQSKTFVLYKPFPHFIDLSPLTFASPEEHTEFYAIKSKENSTIEVSYPYITYSLSVGDFLDPCDVLGGGT